ncbi:MAG: hypothetical protein GF331_24590 [Chitinivibrionales bacterium]|nr:hypothetical protein [Chitinivibrionales bacterium]
MRRITMAMGQRAMRVRSVELGTVCGVRTAICRRLIAGMLVLGGVTGWQAHCQEVVLTPKTVVEFAQRNNTAVLLSRYDAEQHLHALEGAAARMKPSLALHFSYAHLDEAPTMSISPDLSTVDSAMLPLAQSLDGLFGPVQLGPRDVWDIGYSVRQPVFVGTRLLNAYRAARLNHESARLQQQRTVQEVRLSALRLYWSYVAGIQRIRTLDENVAWLEELTADLVALVDAGVIIEEEMLKMKTQLAFARLQQVRARNDLRDLGEQLLVFCNLPLHNEIVVDTTALGVLEQNPEVTEQYVEEVVEGRGDIRALEKRIEALQTVRKGQGAAYLPSVFASFNQDFKNSNPDDFNKLENVWSVGVGLEWQLIDWGAARSERAQTAVAIAKQRLILDARKRAIRADVASAKRRIAEALEAQRLALESVDNAQRALRSADARYREGLITGTELLSSRKELTQAQQELIASRIEKVLAYEEYRAATGDAMTGSGDVSEGGA